MAGVAKAERNQPTTMVPGSRLVRSHFCRGICDIRRDPPGVRADSASLRLGCPFGHGWRRFRVAFSLDYWTLA